jgi:hypothetical protein
MVLGAFQRLLFSSSLHVNPTKAYRQVDRFQHPREWKPCAGWVGIHTIKALLFSINFFDGEMVM